MHLDASVDFDVQLAAAPELGRAAEVIGFGGLWTAETRHDPFLPLVLAAEHTRRIGLGTAVTVAFARSPTVVAHLAWDLARLSQGRFRLGLGTQVRAHVERRFGSPWSGHPVAQMREYVAALRALWHAWQEGTPLRLRGEHYPLTLMTPFFSPGPIEHPRIPIFLAGVGAPMIRLAGEVANGFLVHPLHSRAYLTDVVLPALATGAERTGRGLDAITVAGSLISATDAMQREEARRQIAFYASTPTYRRVLEHHGWGGIGEILSDLARRGRWDEMPSHVSDQILETVAVVAAPDQLGRAILARCQGLLGRVSLYRPFVPGVDDPAWRSLIQELDERPNQPRSGSGSGAPGR